MKQAVFTKSLSFALRPEAYDHIKAIADEQKISLADWVRAAVDAALAKNIQREKLKNDE